MVDELRFGVQANDVAYGRNPVKPERWLFFNEATPGGRNSAYGAAVLETAAEPLFSLNEGFYPGPQTLRITTTAANASVRFTFDGSLPRAGSPEFPDSFSVLRTYVITARAYEQGKLPGPIITRTFFIEPQPTLPVVSLSTDAAHFYCFRRR
jgi:hypothetical protein